ncbi:MULTISPECIES: aldehyde dehydrogenase [unclassified Sphingobium]|uniref:aldehyde dehydrogenase n=1 Tax=unclassified Sphingobium TaxID=2611147 RepID=UPI00159C4BEB|nr:MULTISPECIES: aldehyde dehydrogenase [unclassified Sphingobium]MCB4860978.1 aldehyde dehydrogenase [Sphingobium sp. PNB]
MNLSFENYIGGEFTSANGVIDVLNPATGDVIGRAPDADRGVVDAALRAAEAAQADWARLPAHTRGLALRAIATKIREKLPELARITALEQGKILPLAEMEVALTAEYLDYMAEWGRRIEGEVISSDRPGETMLLFRRPMGVVAGILPWNFPFFMVARKVAPALVTGNTIVVKPSEETPFGAAAFARLVAETDLPVGVFNLICGRGETTGAALVSHPTVQMISFTGSSAAGSAIMASAARNVTKVNLELGGKAPVIVLDDADVDLAVQTLTMSKTINTGQACNCAERVYVQKGVAQQFRDKLAASVGGISQGDPLGGAQVAMGPVINRAAVQRIEALVDNARSLGAEVLAGGAVLEGAGCHYRPTVLAGTTPDMDIMHREIFGPVIVVNEIDDLDQGIALANASDYGLSSSIFTRSLSSAMKAISDLRFGETYVNREHFEAIQGFHAGVRKSGIGGTDGKHGLYEYTHTQVAYIQT